ncbi:hypothetical protein [Tamilnaduibacter salinus]|uniref:hypothetical protein n=1 Tax=Tamilnaduibacter salinus TaxID=1484056 RepID=UPI001B7FFA7E|nr:hypothetical protein [Tamilnaduibacter salinus]
MATLLFLNAWLATRLCFTFRDQPLPRNQWLTLGVIQVLLTGLLTPGLYTFALGGAVILGLILSEVLVPKDRLNEGRLAGGALVWAVAGLALWQGNASSWLLSDHQLTTLQPALTGLLGFLLVANETNLAIRALLHRFQMEPKNISDEQPRTVDDREYNAGRVIGMLERWLIYLVVVFAQNYNVIALILAAKGFARFRQLEEREFAEYVLIGTLASILLTIVIGQGILYAL